MERPSKKQAVQVAHFDIRFNAEYEVPDIKATLSVLGKSWVFQLEQGDTGYKHYQGRVSLKKKRRVNELHSIWKKMYSEETVKVPLPNYCQPTVTGCVGDTFYVMKEDTRVEGPWTDKDEEIYIPRDIRAVMQREGFPAPWQQYIIDSVEIPEDRKVDVIVDYTGGTGKSTVVRYLGVHGKAKKIPFANDFKDVMRMVMDMPTHNCYFIDMPRAIGKERLYQLYGAIEEIKGGYAYDDRYSFKDKYFDPPRVWVFTNSYPDRSLLSSDRWNIWKIDDGQLVSFEEDDS